MNNWDLLANLSYPNYNIGSTRFTSFGDWSCSIYQISKTKIEGPPVVLKSIMKKCRFYDET